MGCKVVSHQIWRFEKKICYLAITTFSAGGLGSTPGQCDHPQSLTDCNFAAP